MRILGVIISAVVLTYLCVQGVRTFLLVRKSSELVAKSMRYEQAPANGSPRIMVIGDSTGVGTGVNDPTLSIAGRFGSEFPNALIRNESVNGWKVADALKHFPEVPAESFDVILLQIGANDIIRGTDIDEFSQSLNTLFQKSTTAATHVFALHSGNIGLAPLFPWPVSRIMRARTLRYREEYRRIAAANGVTYINLYQEAATDPFEGKSGFYAEDLLHLTGQGYGEWYKTIRQAMTAQKVLTEN